MGQVEAESSSHTQLLSLPLRLALVLIGALLLALYLAQFHGMTVKHGDIIDGTRSAAAIALNSSSDALHCAITSPSPIGSPPAGHVQIVTTVSDERLYTREGQTHLSAAGLDQSRLAPLTASFQASLFANQHPRDCSSREYVVFGGWGAGLGSEVHVAGQMLLCAWSLDRVFLWAEGAGGQFTVGPKDVRDPSGGSSVSSVGVTCEGGAEGMACLFLPPSNCTLADAKARPSYAPDSWRRACGDSWNAEPFLRRKRAVAEELEKRGLHTPAVRKGRAQEEGA